MYRSFASGISHSMFLDLGRLQVADCNHSGWTRGAGGTPVCVAHACVEADPSVGWARLAPRISASNSNSPHSNEGLPRRYGQRQCAGRVGSPEPGVPCYAGKWGSVQNDNRDTSPKLGSQLEAAAAGQNWDDLRSKTIKIINHKPLGGIRIYERERERKRSRETESVFLIAACHGLPGKWGCSGAGKSFFHHRSTYWPMLGWLVSWNTDGRLAVYCDYIRQYLCPWEIHNEVFWGYGP